MPRANRFFVPGEVWHITHRCHKQEFLLKYERDRLRWRYWLFQAKKRYGLSVLNYVCTSNHVHLLVQDTGGGVIAKSMQLIAGRVGYEYNQRKSRRGAFWEDRYHATAIATDNHLAQCLVYIDLNMLRARAVSHPSQWSVCGYNEIQQPPKRYRIINQQALIDIFNFRDTTSLQQYHHEWVENQIAREELHREPKWSDALTVGAEAFVRKHQQRLGIRVRYRIIENENNTYSLNEPIRTYGRFP